eukprot:TRINITY_DN1239_c0_g2_i2.p1 TRINITY_DN1239_c0_g2~~TRINITY_DN1239_c0_g2_i2.p1  ORF type:complete len:763 (+),score=221.94 TRINITY_DN1239_c0_g2_i2:184-2472(+)
MRLRVLYERGGEEAEAEVEASSGAGVDEVVAAACSALNVTTRPSSEHALALSDPPCLLSPAHLAGIKLPPLRLRVKPAIEAQESLENLKNKDAPAVQKKAVFDLSKKGLKDILFAEAFIELKGIAVLAEVAQELSGNALAYCLTAIHRAISYGGVASLPERLLPRLLDALSGGKPNIVNPALMILTSVAENAPNGFAKLSAAMPTPAEGGSAFQPILACLSFSALDSQCNALQLLNALISAALAADTPPPDEFLSLHSLLQKHIDIKQPEFRRQLFRYQLRTLHRFEALREQPYDKEKSEHEAQLMELWRAVFPDQELNSRVSEQWKQMGFQGTDPATDFRGMGLLGLHQLTFFARRYPDVFRTIVKEQRSRDDTMYPVAVVGISITNLLYQSLGVGEKERDEGCGTVHEILFDSVDAFDEIYCIVFQLLNRVWDEMGAGYMDFPKVLNEVKDRSTAALGRVTTLAALRRELSKSDAKEKEKEKERPLAKGLTAGLLHPDPRSRGSSRDLSPLQIQRDTRTASDVDMSKLVTSAGQERNETLTDDVLGEINGRILRDSTDIVLSTCVHALKQGALFTRVARDKKKKREEGEKRERERGGGGTDHLLHMRLSEDLRTIEYGAVASELVMPSEWTSLDVREVREVWSATRSASMAKLLKRVEEDTLPRTLGLTLADATQMVLTAPTKREYCDWMDGLRHVLGLPMDVMETAADVETLCEFSRAVRLINLEAVTIPATPPAVPAPPESFDFVVGDLDPDRIDASA